MTERKMDRRMYVLLTASLVTLIATGIILVVAVPKVLSTDSSTHILNDSQGVTSCRALFSAQVTAASSKLTVDKSALDVLTSQGLRASIEHDLPTLQRVLADSPAQEALVLEDGRLVNVANDAYQDAALRANTDPDAFLVACKKNPPVP